VDLSANSMGTSGAFRSRVPGADRFEDLIAWQRMHELNLEIWRITEGGRVSRDFDFCRQIRDAADSAERNIAEGFGRFSPVQFAHFLDISRASAVETETLLKKALAVGYRPRLTSNVSTISPRATTNGGESPAVPAVTRSEAQCATVPAPTERSERLNGRT
jgi:four helix bundle protein